MPCYGKVVRGLGLITNTKITIWLFWGIFRVVFWCAGQAPGLLSKKVLLHATFELMAVTFVFFFFWTSPSNHYLAALDLGAGVEQPFDRLIVQNRQAMQFMGRSIWLDIGGQHGRRFVLLRHTHRSQRRPYPICTSRSGNVRYRCGGG